MRVKIGIILGAALAAASTYSAQAQETNKMTMPPNRILPKSAQLWTQNLGTDVAVFDKTGSTNSPPYSIVAKRSGEVDYECGEDHVRGLDAVEKHVKAPEKTAKLFSDLEKAWPFTAVPVMVMKSASFGTCSYVSYQGTHSADLETIDHDPAVQQIDTDFAELKKLF
jgi:hypothetical protein